MLRIVIAEPAALLRELLTGAFRAEGSVNVVGAASSRAALLDEVGGTNPDVVLGALTFPDGTLGEALVDVMRTGARVLVVCDMALAADATALLFAGASGCLYWQDCSTNELIAATHDVAAGNAALHPAAAASVLTQWREARESPPSGSVDAHRHAADNGSPATNRSVSLTPRENQVLAALARGLPTKAIGREMGLSPKTVEAHIGRLLSKLDARNRAQAVSVAQDYGLLWSGAAAGSKATQ